jgi:hypothetical protein
MADNQAYNPELWASGAVPGAVLGQRLDDAGQAVRQAFQEAFCSKGVGRNYILSTRELMQIPSEPGRAAVSSFPI